MIYRYKISRFSWYRNPITSEFISGPNGRAGVTREIIVEIVKYLKLKTVTRIKQNKKPYITVILTSLDEYRKLVGALSKTYNKLEHKRNLAKYK